MIVAALQLMSVKAVEGWNEQMEASSFSFFDVVLIYTLVVILITVMCMRYPRRTERKAQRCREEEKWKRRIRAYSFANRRTWVRASRSIDGEFKEQRRSEGSDRAILTSAAWARAHRDEILRCAGPSGINRAEQAASRSACQKLMVGDVAARLREEEEVRQMRTKRQRRWRMMSPALRKKLLAWQLLQGFKSNVRWSWTRSSWTPQFFPLELHGVCTSLRRDRSIISSRHAARWPTRDCWWGVHHAPTAHLTSGWSMFVTRATHLECWQSPALSWADP